MIQIGEILVTLVLRKKVYEVKAGLTLLSALKKCNIVPESVIATRDGEMLVEDEVLNDGEEIKLIMVISGGSCRCECDSPKQTRDSYADCFLAASAPRNDGWSL